MVFLVFRSRSIMLARYKMYRGRRPHEDPLPVGERQDTRKHTRHCLRPTQEMVEAYLEAPGNQNWNRFQDAYRLLLARRYNDDPKPFDDLSRLAADTDVYIGCSCPIEKNPNIQHCHTVLALQFMQQRYPQVNVVFP